MKHHPTVIGKLPKAEIVEVEEVHESMKAYATSSKNVVNSVVRRRSVRSPGAAALVDIVQSGLAISEVESLQKDLGIPMERLVSLLAISKSTLHRRRQGDGRLGVAESDRVIRYARLMGRAVEVLESEAAARQWLSSAQYGLGGAVPLDYASTEVGAREVEDLLGRIEYSVYS